MSGLKKALKIILNALSFLLLVLLVLVVYGKATSVFGGHSYPNYFGYTFFSVASGSMEPTLYINDVILVKIGNDDIKKDDIITYANKDDIITHRVIDVNGDSIVVKGDNNNTIDDPISKDQVIGKTIKIYPKLSIWQKVLTEPKIIIVLFITLLLFDFAISYKGKDKKDNKKVENKKEKEILITKINPETKEQKKEKKELLELTRKIDVDEITSLIDEEKDNIPKEEKKPSKGNENLDYTVRLDLNEIQRKIRDKVK